MATKYLLVSLPVSIAPSGERDDAYAHLRATVPSSAGSLYAFPIPELKIGTLDALVRQADELAKLDSACAGVVSKIGDGLRTILDGDPVKMSQQKVVNERPVDQYLQSFSWNKVKYRADRSLAELADMLQKEIVSIDTDFRDKYSQYTQVKTLLTTLQKKQTGNLSTRSLTAVVDPSVLVQQSPGGGSEYLETHLVAVPNPLTKDFLRSYETLAPMVVPRSALRVAADDEYTLYAVTTFRKHSADFVHRCRERRWTPRDFRPPPPPAHADGGDARGGSGDGGGGGVGGSASISAADAERREIERAAQDERRVWGEVLRLGRAGWGDAAMVWVHVLALRVFVETVLRYGLPLEYVSGIIKSTPKLVKKVKQALDGAYSFLGGHALGRDKKGRVIADDFSSAASTLAAADAAGGHGGSGGDAAGEYTPYVYYEFEID